MLCDASACSSAPSPSTLIAANVRVALLPRNPSRALLSSLPAATLTLSACFRYLERYEPEIDAKLSQLQQSADAAFEGLKTRAVKHIRLGSRSLLQASGAALAELAMATATTAALESSGDGSAIAQAPAAGDALRAATDSAAATASDTGGSRRPAPR